MDGRLRAWICVEVGFPAAVKAETSQGERPREAKGTWAPNVTVLAVRSSSKEEEEDEAVA